MKQVTVNLKFDKAVSCRAPFTYVERVITEALKKKGITVTKYRNTYVESEHGLANLPNDLFLANLIDSPSGSGFDWKLHSLSGKYKLIFKQ